MCIAGLTRFALLFLFCAAATSAAPALTPSQQRALDTILATMEPEMRPVVREQLTPTLGIMSDAQIEIMLIEFTKSSDASTDVTNVDNSEEHIATPEDLEYNRQQFEPAIRRAWAASHAFDALVESTLEKNCGQDGSFAVYGSGWRYEVMPMSPNWTRGSASADLDLQLIGATYPPQDGRYQFDFSAMSTDFDEASVTRAIEQACSEYRAIGARFLAVAGTSGGEPPADGQRLENQANSEVEDLRQKLETELQRWPNNWITPLYTAMVSAEPVS